MDGQAASIMDKGCDGFIQKPFNLWKLSEKLQKTIINRTRD